MRLTVQTPVETLLDTPVQSVLAEGLEGTFCLRPRHIDCVAALLPGLLFYTAAEGSDHCLAVDRGVLVKKGDQVAVSVRNAITGVNLEELMEVVENRFQAVDEQQRVVRSAMARLETDFLRRFMELK
ncbi:F0F1 ATP synthase subunit epsilon [Desulfuromonas sp. CSMB_57]|jgi:F-type H+-transporting ATPase subunit epsilon|uniref:F0F1 ATP synthase subunit epsilon n=1 Tax=Desulfuromonas sp. CSMB_57 TaxID=2807629 RepID=UPI001CD33D28|nr:F0F1 ATP synthase subunit epsilon [Desulfuromonas sp. CSMB_57]